MAFSNGHSIKKRYTWVDEAGLSWAEGCDWSGNDIGNVQVQGEQCGSQCAARSGCTHFTWTQYNGGTCWLKGGSDTKEQAVAFTNGYSVCGIMKSSWHEESNLFWAENCDWSGNDIGNVQVPSSQCGPQCAGRSDCTHFTWTQYNGGTCWMKGGSVTPSQALTSTNGYSVCGYMKSSSSGGSLGPTSSGKTTRYWDCCKPSCGWSGKGPVSAPLQTCQRNGVDAIDVNAQSGCSGGPSYTCNSNQPWAVSDSMSYGFSAAHLTGQSEQDWCCACYELEFTNGPAQGKKMVVQVTNTGGDLGENHFDLQIPGGGVGIFNGCQSQWGAPADGWGARYGGVGNRDSCNQLPAQLQPGCFWRFDWFKNADNPTMNLHRVRCPDELVQKSKCRRNDE